MGLSIISVPIPKLKQEQSRVLYDQYGGLLSASIASDGQWRFPIEGNLPDPLKKAILAYEDAYFYKHIGVNPVSLINSVYQNIQHKKVVRGGSTITMQVMRMYRGNKSRTVVQKVIEILGALKLELLYSKKDILKLWATMAPFGGNTVGAQSAAIRYYERNLDELSWAEYATLAVLPNSPAMVHLNRNKDKLLKKRNFVLQKLLKQGQLDQVTYQLAIDEELPKFNPIVKQKAFHYLSFLTQKFPEKSVFHSTIDSHLQSSTQEILNSYVHKYELDGIKNGAAIIIDNKTNEIKAYIGNSTKKTGEIQYVDCAQGLRSYGSLLKPFLYAYSIEKGFFLPNEQVKDIPTNVSGFIPKNFDRDYRGIISLDEFVSKSLNIPSVRVLNYVGVESFYNHLKNELNMATLNKESNHYGLSIILGGAEGSLYDMSRMYKGLVRSYNGYALPYNTPVQLKEEQRKQQQKQTEESVYSWQTIWHTLQAMQSVNRPPEEQQFIKMGGEQIAWKTGTSYGHRDAWSIGCSQNYTVAIWVGNETGEGRYDLTGVKKAAPILFEVFRQLTSSSGFEKKPNQGETVQVCKKSGRLIGRFCPNSYNVELGNFSHQLRNCNQHIQSETGEVVYKVDPVVAYYHDHFFGGKQKKNQSTLKQVQIIYPEKKSVIQIPKKINEEYAKIMVKANSNYEGAEIYWYLDGQFQAKSIKNHQISLLIESGKHIIYISDQFGNSQEVDFEVVKM